MLAVQNSDSIRSYCIHLLLVVLVFALVPSGAVGENTYWQHDPATPGNWFDVANWSLGVPGELDRGIIQNGGTAEINSGEAFVYDVYVGKENKGSGNLVISGGSLTSTSYFHIGSKTHTGSLVQSGGIVNVGDSYLLLGAQAGPPASYSLSGDGQLVTGVSEVGHDGSYYGKFVQDGGTHTTNSLYVMGLPGSQIAYEMNSGVLDVGDRLDVFSWESTPSGFKQRGGSVRADGLLVRNRATYWLEGGILESNEQYVSSGANFIQSGGTSTTTAMRISDGGRYEYSDGTLTIGGWEVDGTWDFTGKTTTLGVNDKAVLDFRNIKAGSVVNAENVTLNAGANTLTIMEPGFDPTSVFPNFSTTGLQHVMGNTLQIPAGAIIEWPHLKEETFSDAVNCQGSLDIVNIESDRYFTFNNTVTVGPSGRLWVERDGRMEVNDHLSSIHGGALGGDENFDMTIGRDAPGTFSMFDGTVSVDQIYLMRDNQSSFLQCGGSLTSNSVSLEAEGENTSSFIQSGGTHTVLNTLIVSSGFNSLPESKYEIHDGATLAAAEIRVDKAHFIQEGGTVYTYLLRMESSYSSTNNYYDMSDGRLETGQVETSDAQIHQSGGEHICYGTIEMDDASNYTLENATLSADVISLKSSKYAVKFNQNSGSVTTGQLLVGNGGERAEYILNGGTLTSDLTKVRCNYADYEDSWSIFAHNGGVHNVGTLVLGSTGHILWDEGRYEMRGGTLNVGQLNIGTEHKGSLHLLDVSATVTVSEGLCIGPAGSIHAVPGSTIHMTGSAFDNQATDPTKTTGLENLTLIFEGGSEDIDPFEVGGEDMGADMAGFTDNFALGTLTLGGEDIGQIQLLNVIDNRPDWEGNEALYVHTLNIGAGSYLDLNGLNLYYLGGSIDPGCTIITNGGSLVQIPEPATLGLLAVGGLAFLRRKRK